MCIRDRFNDIRNYKVNCDKFENMFPDDRPQWTVRKGAESLLAAVIENKLTLEQLEGGRFMRLHHLRQGIESGTIANDLRKLVA